MYKFTLWPNDTRRNALDRVISLIHNEYNERAVDLIIEPHKVPKTSSQRAWFHYLCRELGERMGLPEGKVKDAAKAQILGWRYVKFAGIEIPVPDGSSEDLSKLEYSDLIESVYRLGAECGEILPNPDKPFKNASASEEKTC